MEYQTKAVKCLGVDPGMRHTGYAVVTKSIRGYQMLTSDLIRSDASASIGDRLLYLYQQLTAVIASELPDVIAVEKIFHNKNITSSIGTGGVIGIVHLIGAQSDIDVVEFTPQAIKKCSGLGGRASKKEVQTVMCRLLKMPLKSDHVADAAACAIAGCLSIKNGGQRWQQESFLKY